MSKLWCNIFALIYYGTTQECEWSDGNNCRVLGFEFSASHESWISAFTTPPVARLCEILHLKLCLISEHTQFEFFAFNHTQNELCSTYLFLEVYFPFSRENDMRVEPNFHMTFVTKSQHFDLLFVCCCYVWGQTFTVVDKIEHWQFLYSPCTV